MVISHLVRINPNFPTMVNPVTLDEEFQKNVHLKKEELATLRDWTTKQKYLPPISDKTLALFLNSCFYSVEQTKVTIDNYFTVRTHCPELFDNRDPFKVDVKNGKQVIQFFMLPGKTPDGSRVIFVKFAQTNPSDFNFTDAIKSFVMAADLEDRYNGTSEGFIIVFDMVGIVFGHVAKLNILTIKKILYYLQDAMPVRLKGLHFLNTVPFMDKILAMMKPFMKKQLMNNLHLHGSDFSSFYKFVPLKMLPADYGGESPTIEKIHDAYVQLRKDNKEWFEEEAKLRVVEALRPGRAKNAGDLFGIEGSFKKLDLD